MLMSGRVRFVLAVVGTMVVGLCHATDATAQGCSTLIPPCVDNPPFVGILPSAGTYSNNNLPVTISWADDVGLNPGSVEIRLNGQVVGGFSYSGGSWNSTSEGSVTLASGSNTLTARICDYATPTPQCTTTAAYYTYNPPPPPAPYTKPVVSLAPMRQDARWVDRCVADCYEAVAAYTTPAYVSLDTERAATLVYRSGQGAVRRVLVEVDAADHSQNPPQQMSMRVRRPDGSWVTFTSLSQEIFYSSGSGTTRLAALFDPAGLATGSYVYQVVVRTWWSGGQMEEALPKDFRFIVLNERDSPFGSGWTLAGLQRLHIVDPNDGILITEGDGSAVFFRKTGTSTWTAPDGEFSKLTYSAGTAQYTRTYPDKSLAVFTSTGFLLYVEDRFGNRTSYTYSSGRLTTITDPIGKTISFAYNGSGKLTTITDAAGRQSTFVVNANLNLTTITDPDGIQALSMTWDGSHRLTAYTDRRGAAWDISYDLLQKLATVTAPWVNLSALPFRPVTAFYSWERAVVPVIGGSSVDPSPRVLPANARAQVTDPNSNVTYFALNNFGAPSRIEAPLNQTTVLGWNGHGQLTVVHSPNGRMVSYNYSSTNGNPTQVNDSGTGAMTTITYDTAFSQVAQVSTGGVTVINRLGAKGEVLSSRLVGMQDSTRYTYDVRYRVTSVTEPGGLRTDYFFQSTAFQNTDSVRVVKAGMPNRKTRYTYDAYGRVATVTDPLSNLSQVQYDALNRPTTTIDPLNFTTTLSYSANNVDLYRVTDAKAQVYTYNRNALGWVVSEVDPGNRTTSYSYDRNGNLVTMVNRRGQTISLAYDALNRVTSRTADGATTTWAYDNPQSRWMMVNNAVSRDTIFYDLAGRATDQVTIRGTRRHHVRSSYRKEGPRDTVQMITPWARAIAYNYNSGLQLTSLRDLSGQITNLTHNQAGLPYTIELPTSGTKLKQTLSYTPSKALAGSNYNYAAVQNVLGVTYGSDALDRVTQRYTQAGDSLRQFSYDKNSQLTRHNDFSMSGFWHCDDPMEPASCSWHYTMLPVGQVDYSYDAVGNRTDQSAVLQAGNRLVSFAGYTLQHDLDGNLISKAKAGQPTQLFTWNSLGQLTAVTVGATVVTHRYDGFGRWAERVGGGETLDFIYDGDNLFMEVVGSTLRREYTHYPGIDRPHSMRNWQGESGVTYYYGQDTPGHVLGLANASNQMVNRYRYDPWGGSEMKSETKANPLQYMGRYFDPHGGLYQVRARWYDPQVGRFISEDPIGLAGGINVYAYAANDPVNRIDPTGLCSIRVVGSVGSMPIINLVCKLEALDVDASGEGTGGSRVTTTIGSPSGLGTPYDGLGGLGEGLAGSSEMPPLLIGVVPWWIGGPGSRAIKTLLGRPHPTKIGTGGRPQPYGASGRYMPFEANPGTAYSPLSQIANGFMNGYLETVVGTPTIAYPSHLYATSQTMGRLAGSFVLLLR